MKYGFILSQRKSYGLKRLCRVLGVSSSGYHKWLKRKMSHRQAENINLRLKIEAIFNENRKVYGYRRIQAALRRAGYNYNHKRIRTIMKQSGIKPAQKRKRRVITTDSKGNKLIFPNLLKARNASRPGQILVSDITYVSTSEGWLYMAAVMDLFTREILGYSIDDNMSAQLVRSALMKALNKIDANRVEIFHSDRGKQFSEKSILRIMEAYQIKQSMSRKGNCYDNAAMESFFHTLKTEWLYLLDVTSKDKTKMRIFDYIETFYNTKRSHSSLNYLSPREFKVSMYSKKLIT